MSYLVLARKYRPANFDEVIGQQHITELFKNAIGSGRLAHAYLFSGPRGIGKTSCARILAKSLNCQSAPTVLPCNQCSACKEITQGISFDVIEIDGASNRGIDEVRTIRENVKFAPGYGRYKMYIIDEVHMLTTEAFNALLKTLEEPPEHVKFIFATTEPGKVPATIISRCQRFDFKRITLKTTVEALQGICKKEKLKGDQDALYAIAKAAQGSFRDALSVLDQISAMGEQHIKGEDVYAMLGLVEVDLLFALSEALGRHDCSKALEIFDTIIEKGKDIKQLAKDLVEHFRNLLIIKIGGKTLGRLVDYPVAIKEMYLTQSALYNVQDILNAIDFFVEAQEVARITESLRTPLEIAFAKMTYQEEGSGGDGTGVQQTGFSSDKAAPVRSPVKPVKKDPSGCKFSPAEILKNQKGQVNAASDNSEGSSAEEDIVEESLAVGDELAQTQGLDSPAVDLETIKRAWDALTHAVSRQKMFIATYLQEGFPVAFDGQRVTIGFAQELHFHKESLEDKEYVRLVENIFTEKLKTPVVIKYKIVDAAGGQEDEHVDTIVKTALETFKGEIVNKWHNE